jgi:hypothetical protein
MGGPMVDEQLAEDAEAHDEPWQLAGRTNVVSH